MDAPTSWLNAREAGAYIGRSRRFVLREVKSGRLRAARIGGRGEVLTSRQWLDQYVTEQVKPWTAKPIAVRRRA